LLDSELAEMYGVTTGALNQAVKRNADRFPPDFVFQLSPEELKSLKSQTVISNTRGGRRRSRPYALTEQGVAMLSSVLRSDRAVQVNVQIMRTFVRLRQILSSHTALARKLDELEKKYDENFRVVFDAIRSLMEDQEDQRRKRKPVGYHSEHADS
jgi:DNA-binding PadR family transcriptional regulator